MVTERERRHTEQCEHPVLYPGEPSGYLAWHEWAEKRFETHEQRQCPHCGLWAIHVRKAGVASPSTKETEKTDG